MALDYMERIERVPGKCGGQPVFKGTRVLLRTVLGYLAAGSSVEEILHDFPAISAEDVRAAIAFAATSSLDEIPLPPLKSDALKAR